MVFQCLGAKTPPPPLMCPRVIAVTTSLGSLLEMPGHERDRRVTTWGGVPKGPGPLVMCRTPPLLTFT